MLRNALFVVSCAVAVSGCPDPASKPGTTDPEDGCAKVELEACPNPEGNGPPVNIIIKRTGIKVVPNRVCATPGETLRFNITYATTPRGWVRILPKEASNLDWLQGYNDRTPRKIDLEVTEEPGEYDYFVLAENGMCVDPRIHVKN